MLAENDISLTPLYPVLNQILDSKITHYPWLTFERIESLRFLRSSEVTLGQGIPREGEGQEGYLSIYF